MRVADRLRARLSPTARTFVSPPYRGIAALGHRLIKSHPDSGRGELDTGEIVVGAFVVARGDASEVFEFVKEALDEVAVAIKEGAEGRDVLAVRDGVGIGPRAAFGEGLAQGVAIVGAVGEQDVAGSKGVEHILGRAAIVSLAFGEL